MPGPVLHTTQSECMLQSKVTERVVEQENLWNLLFFLTISTHPLYVVYSTGTTLLLIESGTAELTEWLRLHERLYNDRGAVPQLKCLATWLCILGSIVTCMV